MWEIFENFQQFASHKESKFVWFSFKQIGDILKVYITINLNGVGYFDWYFSINTSSSTYISSSWFSALGFARIGTWSFEKLNRVADGTTRRLQTQPQSFIVHWICYPRCNLHLELSHNCFQLSLVLHYKIFGIFWNYWIHSSSSIGTWHSFSLFITCVCALLSYCMDLQVHSKNARNSHKSF